MVFKARVAIEALEGERTVSDLASGDAVHPTRVQQWRKALREGAAGVFERGGKTAEVDEGTVRDPRATIGERAVAHDPAQGLRGRTAATVPASMSRTLKPWAGQARRGMIERDHPALSIGAARAGCCRSRGRRPATARRARPS